MIDMDGLNRSIRAPKRAISPRADELDRLTPSKVLDYGEMFSLTTQD